VKLRFSEGVGYMKYDKEKYLDTGYYGFDDDVQNHTEKVVKCNKPHDCVSCGEEIKAGEHALYESGFLYGHRVSAYTCLKCIEEWIDESEDDD